MAFVAAVKAVCGLFWPAALVFIWLRAERLLDRAMTAAEARAHPQPAPATPASEPMPQDLRLYVHSQSEGWARSEADKRLREMYAEMGDWAQVRIAIQTGEGE